MATHNVRGLNQRKAEILAGAWKEHRLDVVLLQETKMTEMKVTEVKDAFHDWLIIWAHYLRPEAATDLEASGSAPASNSSERDCRGVAIAVRLELIRPGGPLQLQESSVVRSIDGRMIHCRLEWAGHIIRLVNVYLPNDTAGQKAFLETFYDVAGPREQLVVGGDFNFTMNNSLERRSVVADPSTNPRPESGTLKRWGELFPGMVDVWRQKYSERPGLTWFSSRYAARLDRLHVGPDISSYFQPVRLRAHSPVVSDHNMVAFTLSARTPRYSPSKASPRIKLRFETVPALNDTFEIELDALKASAPRDAKDLLKWYPVFKGQLVALCNRLNRQAKEHAINMDRKQASEALLALYPRIESGEDAQVVLPLLVAARQKLSDIDNSVAEQASATVRRDWIHKGEVPGPLLTAKLQRPRGSGGVAAIRTPAGTLTTDPGGIANVMASFFANVSAVPILLAPAQQEVLRSLEQSKRLSTPQATLLDSPDVTEEEVHKALKRASAGTAPGPDGLPMDLFRKYRNQLAPLLARVFSALAAGHELPRAFHDGAITVLHKAGDRTDPANYRPITLLNADYRAYTRVLAHRLGLVLPDVIDAQQTAFLAHRCMGESILLLQLLPWALKVEGKGAAAVSCDIRKAYDTVCREFLQRAMAALGVGAGFRCMVDRLLSNTKARAAVNGSLSQPMAFHAGVRQGCPLAPLLYLFVGQALTCFLRAKDIGIMLGNQRLSAAQFADDLTALISSVARIPHFISTMNTFGKATGQCLNTTKTRVLLMGTLASDATTVDAGGGQTLDVVQRMTVLGIPLTADLSPVTPDWPARLAEVTRRGSKISSLPISAFGRAIASSTYGVSTLLFHAEYCGLPPEQSLNAMLSAHAALVDHNQDPAKRGQGPRRFSGIAAKNQTGNPASGGFGVLPLREHMAARYTMWWLRLLKGLVAPLAEQAPWVTVARVALKVLMGGLRPSAIIGWRPSPSQVLQMPPPIRLMFEGITKFPDLEVLVPVTPGAWCAAAPLWHNPVMDSLIPGRPLAEVFPELTRLPIYTLWELELVMRELALPVPRLPWFADLSVAARGALLTKLTSYHAALPNAWTQAVGQVAGAPPTQEVFWAVAWATLGWRVGTKDVLLEDLTVRHGTTLQVQTTGAMQPRWDKQLVFQQLAHSTSGGAAPIPVQHQPTMPALLKRMWRVKCGNHIKEPYWRLVLDGIPTAARRRMTAESCWCGVSGADRAHNFWHCPVAQRVVAEMDSELTAAAALTGRQHTPLVTTDVWLARPPGGVLPWLWRLSCMVAIAAMDMGRRMACKLQMGRVQHSSAAIGEKAGRAAMARLWALFAEAASGRRLPSGQVLQEAQPFLSWDDAVGVWVPKRATGA